MLRCKNTFIPITLWCFLPHTRHNRIGNFLHSSFMQSKVQKPLKVTHIALACKIQQQVEFTVFIEAYIWPLNPTFTCTLSRITEIRSKPRGDITYKCMNKWKFVNTKRKWLFAIGTCTGYLPTCHSHNLCLHASL